MSGVEMTVERAKAAIDRWGRQRFYADEYNRGLMLKSYKFRIYPLNIFTLNTHALRIQHAYFGVRAGVRKVIPARLKKKAYTKSVSSSFVESRTLKSSKSSGKFSTTVSKSSVFTKDLEYERQETEKREREQRIIEARQKYASGTRKAVTSKAKSRPGTAEKYKNKKSNPMLVKQPTITDAELKKVMNVAWVQAETDKQKKMKQMQKAKRPPLRSQDSINEEILVNQIVNKAWVTADKMKECEKKKALKPPVLHSRESIQEAHQVSEIVKSAWRNVDEEKKRSASKIPKIKKKPLRSQESINEERLVGQILCDAWDKAEEIKKETMKMRKQAELNRKRPKLHSQKSIQEELAVKSIVNRAWKEVHHEDKHEDTLQNICENDMENESSFENDSDSDASTPKVEVKTEVRQQREREVPLKQEPKIVSNPITVVEEVPVGEVKKARRTRANRKGSVDMTSSKVNKSQYCTNPSVSYKKSPLKDSNTNVFSGRDKMNISVSNLDPEFNEEDLLISPVKENRNYLHEGYLDDECF